MSSRKSTSIKNDGSSHGKKQSRTSVPSNVDAPPSTGRVRRSSVASQSQQNAILLQQLNNSPPSGNGDNLPPHVNMLAQMGSVSKQRSPYVNQITPSSLISTPSLPSTNSRSGSHHHDVLPPTVKADRSNSTTTLPPTVKANRSSSNTNLPSTIKGNRSSSQTSIKPPKPPIDLVQLSSTNMSYEQNLQQKKKGKDMNIIAEEPSADVNNEEEEEDIEDYNYDGTFDEISSLSSDHEEPEVIEETPMFGAARKKHQENKKVTASKAEQFALSNHRVSTSHNGNQQQKQSSTTLTTTTPHDKQLQSTPSTSQTSLRKSSSSSQLPRLPPPQLTTLKPLQLVHPPFTRETYHQLVETNTVPREVYLDYLQELRSPLKKSSQSQIMNLEIPKQVEHWTVKLPTRLEFQNITIRVMKKFPRVGSLTERVASGKMRKKKKTTATAVHQIPPQYQKNHNQHLPHQQSTSHSSSTGRVHRGFEVDLDESNSSDLDSNDFSQYDHHGENDSDNDELFSPSSYNRMNKAKEEKEQRQKQHTRTPSSVARPPPSQLFEDSDSDDYDEQHGGAFGCCKDDFEEHPITILDNLNGVIEPGSMVAIMGGSGAGKSTLLNALSGRIPLLNPQTTPESELFNEHKATNSGSILFNGTRVTESELASMTGYVMQNDVFLSTLTVRETLDFAAKLQLPPSISQERRDKRVTKVIEQMDMSHIANSPIGGMFSKGISGGQKRRVSTAIELIKDPNVIFLDEPTSGLDSTTANNVMKVLKHLSQTGRTVIFTIHSPSSKILELFDTMILLSRGRLAYFGPAQKTLPYFSSLGYDCPLFSNAAEFYLNVLTPCTVAMYKTMLTNSHHSPEDMLTNFDPRFKTIQLLRAALGYHYDPQEYSGSTYSSKDSILAITSSQKMKDIAGKNIAGKNGKKQQQTSTSHNAQHSSKKQVSTHQIVEFNADGTTKSKPSANSLDEHLTTPATVDWTNQFLGYSSTIMDDEWSVYINGHKKETLRQKRKRHLIEQQHKQYNTSAVSPTSENSHSKSTNSSQQQFSPQYWNYTIFPQSTHIYQQYLKPIVYDDTNPEIPDPPPYPPQLDPSAVPPHVYQSFTSSPQQQQLYDIEQIITDRENRRLIFITDTYLKSPVQVNHSLSPFLSNYVPKLRNLDKEGTVALQEMGFDVTKKKIDVIQPGKAPLPWFQQFITLTHRTFLNTIRDPINTILRVAVNLVLSFFVGLLFLQTGNYQYSIYAIVGFLFFLTSIQAFITVMGAVLTFSEERALFIREYHKQIYSTSAYFLGKTVVDVVYQTILSILFGCLAYPMVGLSPGFGPWLKYTISIILVAQGSSGYAFILGALCPYQTIALLLSPLTMTPFLTVSGFLCPLNDMSPVISWLTWFSPQRWAFEALLTDALRGFQFQCKPNEYITIPLDNGTMQRECPVLNGTEVLSLFGLSQSSNTFVVNSIAGLIIAVLTKIAALYCLKFSAWYHTKNSIG